MRLMNLTNNTITIYDETGERALLELPTEPPAATALSGFEEVEVLYDDDCDVGVPVVRHIFYDAAHVPPPEDGVIYVVSYPVLQALNGERPDCVTPDTARESAVRNVHGRIVGVRRFRTS